jgi:hypothetical protein
MSAVALNKVDMKTADIKNEREYLKVKINE